MRLMVAVSYVKDLGRIRKAVAGGRLGGAFGGDPGLDSGHTEHPASADFARGDGPSRSEAAETGLTDV